MKGDVLLNKNESLIDLLILLMDGWMDGLTDGWMDGLMDGWMNGSVGRSIDLWLSFYFRLVFSRKFSKSTCNQELKMYF